MSGWQERVYSVMTPFLSPTAGGSQEKVSDLGSSGIIVNSSGGPEGAASGDRTS